MIFLSHSSADRPFVQFAAEELRLCGHPIWLDIREMSPGSTLSASIDSAISRSSYFLIFLSPQSLISQWVAREIAVAKDIASSRTESFVIPCLVGSVEVTDLDADLQDRLCVDLRDANQYETSMNGLLARLQVDGARTVLPPIDAARSDYFAEQASTQTIQTWLSDFLRGSVVERKDPTERYWSYVTLGRIGSINERSFLESARLREHGFAAAGVRDGLDALQARFP